MKHGYDRHNGDIFVFHLSRLVQRCLVSHIFKLKNMLKNIYANMPMSLLLIILC